MAGADLKLCSAPDLGAHVLYSLENLPAPQVRPRCLQTSVGKLPSGEAQQPFCALPTVLSWLSAWGCGLQNETQVSAEGPRGWAVSVLGHVKFTFLCFLTASVWSLLSQPPHPGGAVAHQAHLSARPQETDAASGETCSYRRSLFLRQSLQATSSQCFKGASTGLCP